MFEWATVEIRICSGKLIEKSLSLTWLRFFEVLTAASFDWWGGWHSLYLCVSVLLIHHWKKAINSNLIKYWVKFHRSHCNMRVHSCICKPQILVLSYLNTIAVNTVKKSKMLITEAFSCFSLWAYFENVISQLSSWSTEVLPLFDAYSMYSNNGPKSNDFPLPRMNALIYCKELPFSAWSMICRSAFFRLLALSISCSLDLKGLDWSVSLSSGEMGPAGTSWALASSLRALTKESSFSFNMAHWDTRTNQNSL